jgi:hypothetical protein
MKLTDMSGVCAQWVRAHLWLHLGSTSSNRIRLFSNRTAIPNLFYYSN